MRPQRSQRSHRGPQRRHRGHIRAPKCRSVPQAHACGCNLAPRRCVCSKIRMAHLARVGPRHHQRKTERFSASEAVERWLAAQDHVGRTDVQALKDELKQVDSTPLQHAPVSPPSTTPPASDSSRSTAAPAVPSLNLAGLPRTNAATSGSASKSIRSLPGSITLWARYDDTDVTIDLGAAPEEAGYVFIQKAHGADRVAVLASRVQLLRITKASAV